jgi:hypothetical protein
MIFLIEYDRGGGRTLLFKTYKDTERYRAQEDRLEIELDRNRKGVLLQREVVLLEAVNEKALRRTHERYFENLPEDVKSASLPHASLG